MLYDGFDLEEKITVMKVIDEKQKLDSEMNHSNYQKTVKLSITDLDDDDLIDEDDLLNSYNSLMSGLTTTIPDKVNKKDCKISRNACKNCTCGRADESVVSESKTSMCGNCYLGDGFRCSTCPSKGLPPFDPDESYN
jgi:hypothetical protein